MTRRFDLWRPAALVAALAIVAGCTAAPVQSPQFETQRLSPAPLLPQPTAQSHEQRQLQMREDHLQLSGTMFMPMVGPGAEETQATVSCHKPSGTGNQIHQVDCKLTFSDPATGQTREHLFASHNPLNAGICEQGSIFWQGAKIYFLPNAAIIKGQMLPYYSAYNGQSTTPSKDVGDYCAK